MAPECAVCVLRGRTVPDEALIDMGQPTCSFDRSRFDHDDGTPCLLPPIADGGMLLFYVHSCPAPLGTPHRYHWCLPAAEAEGSAIVYSDIGRSVLDAAVRAGVVPESVDTVLANAPERCCETGGWEVRRGRYLISVLTRRGLSIRLTRRAISLGENGYVGGPQ